MSSEYAIDRFDGQDWVVLEDGASRTFQVPRSWLPSNAREGSVLKVDADLQADGSTIRIVVDADATASRTRKADELRQGLPRGPRGDVAL